MLPPVVGAWRRCMATCWNGPKAPMRPIRTSSRGRGRSENTMESSCATSTSCAAAPALPPFHICGPPTATSFLPMPNGNSWASDSQRRCDIHHHRQSPLELYDFEPQRHTFRDEVLQGLQDTRKELPSKYFYDDAGSRLFEQICAWDELLTHRVWQRQQYEDPHAAGCSARPGWLRAYRHCERAVTALSSSTDPSLSSIGSAARVC